MIRWPLCENCPELLAKFRCSFTCWCIVLVSISRVKWAHLALTFNHYFSCAAPFPIAYHTRYDCRPNCYTVSASANCCGTHRQTLNTEAALVLQFRGDMKAISRSTPAWGDHCHKAITCNLRSQRVNVGLWTRGLAAGNGGALSSYRFMNVVYGLCIGHNGLPNISRELVNYANRPFTNVISLLARVCLLVGLFISIVWRCTVAFVTQMRRTFVK